MTNVLEGAVRCLTCGRVLIGEGKAEEIHEIIIRQLCPEPAETDLWIKVCYQCRTVVYGMLYSALVRQTMGTDNRATQKPRAAIDLNMGS